MPFARGLHAASRSEKIPFPSRMRQLWTASTAPHGPSPARVSLTPPLKPRTPTPQRRPDRDLPRGLLRWRAAVEARGGVGRWYPISSVFDPPVR